MRNNHLDIIINYFTVLIYDPGRTLAIQSLRGQMCKLSRHLTLTTIMEAVVLCAAVVCICVCVFECHMWLFSNQCFTAYLLWSMSYLYCVIFTFWVWLWNVNDPWGDEISQFSVTSFNLYRTLLPYYSFLHFHLLPLFIFIFHLPTYFLM